jgi:hypothetical protein
MDIVQGVDMATAELFFRGPYFLSLSLASLPLRSALLKEDLSMSSQQLLACLLST